MKPAIRIRAVSNGYVVTDDVRDNFCTSSNEYVFETFGSLVSWLSENLEDPLKQRGRKITATEAVEMAKANPARL